MTRSAILGGTFDPFHDGHKALFKKAFELSDTVIIGLTSNKFAQQGRKRQVTDYSKRKLQLAIYLKKTYPGKKFTIHEMTDIYNKPMTRDIREGYLVVSEGTEKVARSINRRRKKNGIDPLDIVTVPYVLAEDGLPIKATRVYNGEIDRVGKILGKVIIAVGSSNRIKIGSVKEAFTRVYGDVIVKGYDVDSEVSDQPKNRETITGAKNRALNAMVASAPGSRPHFAVGLEAGLFRVPGINKLMDVQYCAIVDRGGNFTFGHSPGFYYPSSFDGRIREGLEIEEIMEDLFKIKSIGEKNGAIGFLTGNMVTRKDLLVYSVLMALVPRLKRELYER